MWLNLTLLHGFALTLQAPESQYRTSKFDLVSFVIMACPLFCFQECLCKLDNEQDV